jgi:hypothetical protein
MSSPEPPRRKLTAAQKRAGIKLVKGWKQPEEPDPAGIYRCFASPARIKGKEVKIGSGESRVLHRQAIWRGMTTKTGRLRRKLTWQEKLVMTLRHTTAAPDFNHEWWGAKTLEPAWVKKAEEIYLHTWLYFPRTPGDMTTKALGNKVGYFLTLAEAKLELAVKDRAYLADAEQSELQRAQWKYEPEERKKVSIRIAGYDSWKEMVNESYGNALDLRSFVFSLVGTKATRTELAEFLEGYLTGSKKAASIDLKDELSEYRKTQEVVGVMLESWPTIEDLQNRTEISRCIRDRLPDEKKDFLRKDEDKKDSPWKDFCVWMREIYDKIGLRPSGKGRPKKNGKTAKE